MYARLHKNYIALRDELSELNTLSVSSDDYTLIFDTISNMLASSSKSDICVSLCMEIIHKDRKYSTDISYISAVVQLSLFLIVDHMVQVDTLIKTNIEFEADDKIIVNILKRCNGKLYIPTPVTFLLLFIDQFKVLQEHFVNLRRLMLFVLSNHKSRKYRAQDLAIACCYYCLTIFGDEEAELHGYPRNTDIMDDVHYLIFATESTIKTSIDVELSEAIKTYLPEDRIILKRLKYVTKDLSKKSLPNTSKTTKKETSKIRKKGDKIGSGSGGTVYKYRDGNKTVAVKKMQEIEQFAHETVIMLSLKNKHIQNAHEFYEENESYYIVMPLQANTLTKMLGKSKIDSNMQRTWVKQIAIGIDFLHSHGIMHGDLKTDNILLSKSNTIKIADFGISDYFVLPSAVEYSTKYITATHRPPELLLSNKDVVSFSFEVDIWSYGILVCEIIQDSTIDNIIGSDKLQDIKTYVLANFVTQYTDLVSEADSDINRLVRRCLSVQSVYRPTSAEILTLI